jgi:hypothetical protein
MRVGTTGVLALCLSSLSFEGCSGSLLHNEKDPSAIAKPSPSATFEAPTVGFCDLVQQPERYDRKLVRTKATVVVDNYENAFLFSSECKNRGTYTHFRVESDQARQSLDAALRPFIKGKVSGADVTIVGQFLGPNKEGYGHLNRYRFEFLIKKVEKAEQRVPDLQ